MYIQICHMTFMCVYTHSTLCGHIKGRCSDTHIIQKIHKEYKRTKKVHMSYSRSVTAA